MNVSDVYIGEHNLATVCIEVGGIITADGIGNRVGQPLIGHGSR